MWGRNRKILSFLATFFFAMLITAGVVLAEMDHELGECSEVRTKLMFEICGGETGPHSSMYRTTMCTHSSAKVDPNITGFLFQPFVTSALIVIFYFGYSSHFP